MLQYVIGVQGETMNKKIYISKEEREKCQKIVNAFADLYDRIDIVVKDTGKYGFVKLYCHEPCYNNFCKISTFTKSKELFDDLWQEWWHEQVFILALNTPLIELDYPDILKALPIEKQNEIISQKEYFMEKCN